MSLEITNTTSPDGAMTVIHAAGCPGVQRDRKYGPVITFEADCRADVARDIFDSQIAEGSMTLREAIDELTFKGCIAADLPTWSGNLADDEAYWDYVNAEDKHPNILQMVTHEQWIGTDADLRKAIAVIEGVLAARAEEE